MSCDLSKVSVILSGPAGFICHRQHHSNLSGLVLGCIFYCEQTHPLLARDKQLFFAVTVFYIPHKRKRRKLIFLFKKTPNSQASAELTPAALPDPSVVFSLVPLCSY